MFQCMGYYRVLGSLFHVNIAFPIPSERHLEPYDQPRVCECSFPIAQSPTLEKSPQLPALLTLYRVSSCATPWSGLREPLTHSRGVVPLLFQKLERRIMQTQNPEEGFSTSLWLVLERSSSAPETSLLPYCKNALTSFQNGATAGCARTSRKALHVCAYFAPDCIICTGNVCTGIKPVCTAQLPTLLLDNTALINFIHTLLDFATFLPPTKLLLYSDVAKARVSLMTAPTLQST